MSLSFPKLSQAQRKYIRSLHRSKVRDEEQSFLVEGEKLCREIIRSEYKVSFIVIRNNTSPNIIELAQEFSGKGIEVFISEASEFDSLCDAKTPQDIIAIAKYPTAQTYLHHKKIIVLDRVADPGNVGTIIRTAEWFGFESIILGNGCADRFNPKTVRSTMGSLFRISVRESSNLEEYLRTIPSDYAILGALLNGEKELSECSRSDRAVLVFGNESMGIEQSLIRYLTGTYTIKGYGEAESLNVAVAAGISMFHFADL